jgi:hypothetical protein
MVTIIPARSSAPASECLPTMSRTRMDKPHRFTPVHRRAPTPGLSAPEPELVGASCLPLPHAGESAYDHPALRPSVDDDAEWSTLPKRKPPPPPAQSKNSITSSAKFLLPIRTRSPSPTESREAEAGKRPRITLYRPPPRTAAIDLAGLESRYACVRSAMRKVRALGRNVRGGGRADKNVGAVASPCVCGSVGRAGTTQLRRSVCQRERRDRDRDSCLARASKRELDGWLTLGFQLCNKSWVWCYAPYVFYGTSKTILSIQF